VTPRKPSGPACASFLSVLLFAACGGSSPDLRTLTEADVTGMVAGNAKGSTFAGIYMVDSSSVTACRCRSGTCREVRPQVGATFAVEQQDGALTISGCLGGVNEDGTFWCGGAAKQADTEFTLNSGTFTVVAELPSRVDVVSETTFVTGFGAPFDCDFQGRSSARYLGRP
jgi:hypothetical protein